VVECAVLGMEGTVRLPAAVLLAAIIVLVCVPGCGSVGGGDGEALPDYHILQPSGGGDAAIAFGPDGSPRVVFVGAGGLKYAYQGKSGWVIQDLAVSGALPAMAIDSTGTPHVTYYSGGSTMSYLTRGKDGQWVGYALEGMGGIGQYGKGEVNHHLRVDSKDNLHLLYYNDVLPGRLIYGFLDQTGWKLTDVATGVTARNNWLDLNEDDEPFAGWYDTDRFVWGRKSEGFVPHKLGLLNDAVTEQGHFCAMVVTGEATVLAKFWGTYRWTDSYGNKYADDVFIQAVTPDGGTVLLNNATLAPGEPLYSPGPTILYENDNGGMASVSYRDGGLWGAFGGRIPVNLGHWAKAYGYAIDFRTGAEAVVWLQEDDVFYYEGPDKPTEDTGGGGPWGQTPGGSDVVRGDDAPSCTEPDAGGGPPEWQPVGALGFSAGETYAFDIAADGGVVWAAYRDSVAGNRVTVQRYQGCQWTPVGGVGLSAGEINMDPSISLYEGKPWVAYADASLWDTVVVKQYGGAGWMVVGGPNSLGKPTNALSLRVVNGLPYVAMARADSFYRPSVMRFDTVQWEPLGDEFLSDVGTQALDLFLYKGFIGVAFGDGNQGGAVTARHFDAAKQEWTALGPDGITPGEARPLSVASAGDVVWAAYADSTAMSKVSVMKFDGTSWEQAGPAGFSTDAAKSVSIGADYNGIPYLVIESVPGKVEVFSYEGGEWFPLGDASPYLYLADEPVLHVSPEGTVYLAFSDQAAGGKLSVIQYR